MSLRLHTATQALWMLLAATLGGCALWEDRVIGFESARVYWHYDFASDAECAAAQAAGWNCVQELLLCPGGGGHVVFDDIIEPIRYSVRHDVVVVSPSYSTSVLRFSMAADGSSLVDMRSGSRWQRVPHEEARLEPYHCRAG